MIDFDRNFEAVPRLATRLAVILSLKRQHSFCRRGQMCRLVVALFDYFRLSVEPVKKLIDRRRLYSDVAFFDHRV
jgi:hypothetical protein